MCLKLLSLLLVIQCLNKEEDARQPLLAEDAPDQDHLWQVLQVEQVHVEDLQTEDFPHLHPSEDPFLDPLHVQDHQSQVHAEDLQTDISEDTIK